jgi:predicted RNA methylase
MPHLDRETLSIAIDTYFSRGNAGAKLGNWAQNGYFSVDILEQASRQAISIHRSSFFSGLKHVLEIGTGTGADTASLARVAHQVTTIEADASRAELASENLRIQGINNVTVIVGDVESACASLDLNSFDGLFADPARRTRDGKRVREASDYSPPLDFLISLPVGRVRAIKVSPGLFFDLPNTSWRRHFIGVGDECLEQSLLFGVPVADSSVYRADLQVGWAPDISVSPPIFETRELGGYICEAHALINRSQYLSLFFAERGIAQISSDVAYGISDVIPANDPFLDSFRIVDAAQFSTSRLQRMLEARGWTSRTEFKKRNCSLDLDAVRTSLRLPPHSHQAPFGTVFLFKWHGSYQVVLGERVCD